MVPAHAEEYISRADFWAWVASQGRIGSAISQITGVGCPVNEDGRHRAHNAVWDGVAGHYICTCDDCGDTFIATKSDLDSAYSEHVDDLPISGINSAGSYVWYPRTTDIVWSEGVRYYDNGRLGFSIPDLNGEPIWTGQSNAVCTDGPDGHSIAISTTRSGNTTTYSVGPKIVLSFIPPVEGTYSLNDHYLIWSGYAVEYFDGASTHSDTWVVAEYGNGGSSEYRRTSDNLQYSPSYEQAMRWSIRDADLLYHFPIYTVTPAVSYALDLYESASRPASISGKYVNVSGDVYEDNSTVIVNEDNSSVYNPATGETTTYESWSYDYSTRTYTLTDNTNNSTSTVTYGDENITINEGGNTYNIYYGTVVNNGDSGGEGGGGTSGEDSDDDGILSRVGELLGTLVNGLLGGVTAFLSGILDGLIALANVISEKFSQVVELVLGWFDDIPSLFAGFLALLSAIFPFIPAEVTLLLTFGIAAIVFVGIIKAIRR